MANSISHAALPCVIRGARATIAIPFNNPDGGAESPATQISKDGGAYADCTNELTIVSGGDIGYLTLTETETDAALILLKCDVVSGESPTVMSIQPENLPVLFTGTAQAGGASTITMQAGSFPTQDDVINGAIVHVTAGTGSGQAREIKDYNGSTGQITVDQAWETNPSTDSVYSILDPGGYAATLTRVSQSSFDTNVPNVLSLANIESQCNDALVANQLDKLVLASAAAVSMHSNSLWARLTTVAGDYTTSYDSAHHSLEALQRTSVMIRTVITAVSDQTHFTIANGSPDNDAYRGRVCVIEKAGDPTQKTVTGIADYTGATGDVTLSETPTFTIGINDVVTIALPPSVRAIRDELDVNSSKLIAINNKTTNLPTDPADQSAVEAAITAATSGLSTLTAAGVRTAIGMASANLDSQLDALPTAAEVTAAVFAKTIDGKTFEDWAEIVGAGSAGNLTGAGSGTEILKGLDGVTTRITATADEDGNRTCVYS